MDVAPGSLPPGAVLMGKWRIVRALAKGGMSTVYEAVHRNGRRVAVKVLHPALAADKRARSRFLRESSLANRVNHRAVVAVIDEDMTPDGTVFLVMELLTGESLDQRWERHSKCLPLSEVLSIATEILDPLAAVHSVGIIHRDLKPSNVFLSSTGVKLLDFGIARLREVNPDEPAITRSGTMLGTPPFMAPEQARGHLDEVDARTDIWAVGAILFSLLTGRFVHEGRTPNELLIAAATQQPVSLARVVPALPAAVTELVDRALSFHKKDRWPDAATMLHEVEAIRSTLGAPASAAFEASSNLTFTSTEQVTSPEENLFARRGSLAGRRRNRALLILSAGGLALVAGAMGLRRAYPAGPAALATQGPALTERVDKPDDVNESRAKVFSAPAISASAVEGAAAEASSPIVSAPRPSNPRVRPARKVAASEHPPTPTPGSQDPLPASANPTIDAQPTPATFSGIAVDNDALDQRK